MSISLQFKCHSAAPVRPAIWGPKPRIALHFPEAWSTIGSVMKRSSLITALLVTVAATVNARDEHLDTLNVGNDIYKNVTITCLRDRHLFYAQQGNGEC